MKLICDSFFKLQILPKKSQIFNSISQLAWELVCHKRFDSKNAQGARDDCKKVGGFLPQPITRESDEAICSLGETWLDFEFKGRGRPGWYKLGFKYSYA